MLITKISINPIRGMALARLSICGVYEGDTYSVCRLIDYDHKGGGSISPEDMAPILGKLLKNLRQEADQGTPRSCS